MEVSKDLLHARRQNTCLEHLMQQDPYTIQAVDRHHIAALLEDVQGICSRWLETGMEVSKDLLSGCSQCVTQSLCELRRVHRITLAWHGPSQEYPLQLVERLGATALLGFQECL